MELVIDEISTAELFNTAGMMEAAQHPNISFRIGQQTLNATNRKEESKTKPQFTDVLTFKIAANELEDPLTEIVVEANNCNKKDNTVKKQIGRGVIQLSNYHPKPNSPFSAEVSLIHDDGKGKRQSGGTVKFRAVVVSTSSAATNTSASKVPTNTPSAAPASVAPTVASSSASTTVTLVSAKVQDAKNVEKMLFDANDLYLVVTLKHKDNELKYRTRTLDGAGAKGSWVFPADVRPATTSAVFATSYVPSSSTSSGDRVLQVTVALMDENSGENRDVLIGDCTVEHQLGGGAGGSGEEVVLSLVFFNSATDKDRKKSTGSGELRLRLHTPPSASNAAADKASADVVSSKGSAAEENKQAQKEVVKESVKQTTETAPPDGTATKAPMKEPPKEAAKEASKEAPKESTKANEAPAKVGLKEAAVAAAPSVSNAASSASNTPATSASTVEVYISSLSVSDMKNVELMPFDKNDLYCVLSLADTSSNPSSSAAASDNTLLRYETEVRDSAGANAEWTLPRVPLPSSSTVSNQKASSSSKPSSSSNAKGTVCRIAPHVLTSHKLSIHVYDHNSIAQHTLIGSCDVPLPAYASSDASLKVAFEVVCKGKKVGKGEVTLQYALSDHEKPADNSPKSTAKSDSSVAEKPAAAKAKESEQTKPVDDSNKQSQAPSAQEPLGAAQLLITQIDCRDLINVERLMGKNDVFVTLQYAQGKTYSSEVAEEAGSACSFEHLDYVFDVNSDALDFEHLLVRVFDKNSLTQDVLIGSASLSLRSIQNSSAGAASTFQLPCELYNEAATMKKTKVCGRVTLHCALRKVDSQQLQALYDEVAIAEMLRPIESSSSQTAELFVRCARVFDVPNMDVSSIQISQKTLSLSLFWSLDSSKGPGKWKRDESVSEISPKALNLNSAQQVVFDPLNGLLGPLTASALKTERLVAHVVVRGITGVQTDVSGVVSLLPSVQNLGKETQISVALGTQAGAKAGRLVLFGTLRVREKDVVEGVETVTKKWEVPKEFESGVLVISEIRCASLENRELVGLQDPYVQLSYGDKDKTNKDKKWTARTSTASGGDVQWTQLSMRIPVASRQQLETSLLSLQVMEENTASADILIGAVDLHPLAHLLALHEHCDIALSLRGVKRGGKEGVTGQIRLTCALFPDTPKANPQLTPTLPEGLTKVFFRVTQILGSGDLGSVSSGFLGLGGKNNTPAVELRSSASEDAQWLYLTPPHQKGKGATKEVCWDALQVETPDLDAKLLLAAPSASSSVLSASVLAGDTPVSTSSLSQHPHLLAHLLAHLGKEVQVELPLSPASAAAGKKGADAGARGSLLLTMSLQPSSSRQQHLRSLQQRPVDADGDGIVDEEQEVVISGRAPAFELGILQIHSIHLLHMPRLDLVGKNDSYCLARLVRGGDQGGAFEELLCRATDVQQECGEEVLWGDLKWSSDIVSAQPLLPRQTDDGVQPGVQLEVQVFEHNDISSSKRVAFARFSLQRLVYVRCGEQVKATATLLDASDHSFDANPNAKAKVPPNGNKNKKKTLNGKATVSVTLSTLRVDSTDLSALPADVEEAELQISSVSLFELKRGGAEASCLVRLLGGVGEEVEGVRREVVFEDSSSLVKRTGDGSDVHFEDLLMRTHVTRLLLGHPPASEGSVKGGAAGDAKGGSKGGAANVQTSKSATVKTGTASLTSSSGTSLSRGLVLQLEVQEAGGVLSAAATIARGSISLLHRIKGMDEEVALSVSLLDDHMLPAGRALIHCLLTRRTSSAADDSEGVSEEVRKSLPTAFKLRVDKVVLSKLRLPSTSIAQSLGLSSGSVPSVHLSLGSGAAGWKGVLQGAQGQSREGVRKGAGRTVVWDLLDVAADNVDTSALLANTPSKPATSTGEGQLQVKIVSPATLTSAETVLGSAAVSLARVLKRFEQESVEVVCDLRDTKSNNLMGTAALYLTALPCSEKEAEEESEEVRKTISPSFLCGILKISRIDAVDLRRTETLTKQDPFVKAAFGPLWTDKSPTIADADTRCRWPNLPFSTAPLDRDHLLEHLLTLQVMNENTLTAHDLIGECAFSLAPLTFKVGEEVRREVSLYHTTTSKKSTKKVFAGKLVVYMTLLDAQKEVVEVVLPASFDRGQLLIRAIHVHDLAGSQLLGLSRLDPQVSVLLGSADAPEEVFATSIQRNAGAQASWSALDCRASVSRAQAATAEVVFAVSDNKVRRLGTASVQIKRFFRDAEEPESGASSTKKGKGGKKDEDVSVTLDVLGEAEKKGVRQRVGRVTVVGRLEKEVEQGRGINDAALSSSLPADFTAGTLLVTSLSAQGLKNTELVGKQDPFCRVSLSDDTWQQTTSTLANAGANPAWNQLSFACAVSRAQIDGSSSSNSSSKDSSKSQGGGAQGGAVELLVHFFEQNDLVKADESLGSCRLSLQPLARQPLGQPLTIDAALVDAQARKCGSCSVTLVLLQGVNSRLIQQSIDSQPQSQSKHKPAIPAHLLPPITPLRAVEDQEVVLGADQRVTMQISAACVDDLDADILAATHKSSFLALKKSSPPQYRLRFAFQGHESSQSVMRGTGSAGKQRRKKEGGSDDIDLWLQYTTATAVSERQTPLDAASAPTAKKAAQETFVLQQLSWPQILGVTAHLGRDDVLFDKLCVSLLSASETDDALPIAQCVVPLRSFVTKATANQLQTVTMRMQNPKNRGRESVLITLQLQMSPESDARHADNKDIDKLFQLKGALQLQRLALEDLQLPPRNTSLLQHLGALVPSSTKQTPAARKLTARFVAGPVDANSSRPAPLWITSLPAVEVQQSPSSSASSLSRCVFENIDRASPVLAAAHLLGGGKKEALVLEVLEDGAAAEEVLFRGVFSAKEVLAHSESWLDLHAPLMSTPSSASSSSAQGVPRGRATLKMRFTVNAQKIEEVRTVASEEVSSQKQKSKQKTALPGDQESVAPPSASSSSSSEVQTLRRQQEVLQSKLLQLETALRTSSAAAEEGGAHKEVRQKMQTLEMQNADLKAQLEQLQKAMKAQAIREKKEKEALQQEAPLQLQPLQQAQLPKCVDKWRNAHVLAWLAFEVELPAYLASFAAASVDGPLLLHHLDAPTLKEHLQVEDALHLAKLLTCIEQLKAQNARYLAKRAQEKEAKRLAQIALQNKHKKKLKDGANENKAKKRKTKRLQPQATYFNNTTVSESNQLQRTRLERLLQSQHTKQRQSQKRIDSLNKSWNFEYTGTPRRPDADMQKDLYGHLSQTLGNPRSGRSDPESALSGDLGREIWQQLQHSGGGDEGMPDEEGEVLMPMTMRMRSLPRSATTEEVRAAVSDSLQRLGTWLVHLERKKRQRTALMDRDLDEFHEHESNYYTEEEDEGQDDDAEDHEESSYYAHTEDERDDDDADDHALNDDNENDDDLPLYTTLVSESKAERHGDLDEGSMLLPKYDELIAAPPPRSSSSSSKFRTSRRLPTSTSSHQRTFETEKAEEPIDLVALVFSAFVHQTNNSAQWLGPNSKLTRLKLQGGFEALLKLQMHWTQFDALWTLLDYKRTGDVDLREFSSFFFPHHISNAPTLYHSGTLRGTTSSHTASFLPSSGNVNESAEVLRGVLYALCDALRKADFSVQEMFRAFDRNASNAVSLSEFCALVRNVLGPMLLHRLTKASSAAESKKVIYNALRVLDVDNDKQITLQEFSLFVYRVWRSQLEELTSMCYGHVTADKPQAETRLLEERALLKDAIKRNFPRHWRDLLEQQSGGHELPGPFAHLIRALEGDGRGEGVGGGDIFGSRRSPTKSSTVNSDSFGPSPTKPHAVFSSSPPTHSHPHPPTSRSTRHTSTAGQNALLRLKVRLPQGEAPVRVVHKATHADLSGIDDTYNDRNPRAPQSQLLRLSLPSTQTLFGAKDTGHSDGGQSDGKAMKSNVILTGEKTTKILRSHNPSQGLY